MRTAGRHRQAEGGRRGFREGNSNQKKAGGSGRSGPKRRYFRGRRTHRAGPISSEMIQKQSKNKTYGTSRRRRWWSFNAREENCEDVSNEAPEGAPRGNAAGRVSTLAEKIARMFPTRRRREHLEETPLVQPLEKMPQRDL